MPTDNQEGLCFVHVEHGAEAPWYADQKGRTWQRSPVWRKLVSIHNSVALVRERTIQTERPPPVGEVSANFCG